jgi:hypothetical protein
MTWYADNTECDFFGIDIAPYIRSVGWLDKGESFETGNTPEPVYKALIELISGSPLLIATPGIRICNLCQFDGEIGQKSLLIPGNGHLYFFPELIIHYIGTHWYKPPESFSQAVLNCPPIKSMEYKKKFLDNGGRKLVQNKVISW